MIVRHAIVIGCDVKGCMSRLQINIQGSAEWTDLTPRLESAGWTVEDSQCFCESHANQEKLRPAPTNTKAGTVCRKPRASKDV